MLALAYGRFAGKVGRMAYGTEHTGVGSFGVDALGGIDPPAGYVKAARVRARMDEIDRPEF